VTQAPSTGDQVRGRFTPLFAVLSMALILLAISGSGAEAHSPYQEDTLVNNSGVKNPDIYGNSVVYADGFDIYRHQISTSTDTLIGTRSSYFSSDGPAIYANRVVWEEGGNIKAINLGTCASSPCPETTVSAAALTQRDPDIWNGIVVYTDGRNGNDEIYMYNLGTSTETRITNNGAVQEHPQIIGDYIVWTDWRHTNAEIYQYRISTSTTTRITNHAADQTHPVVYGNMIAYRDDRNGQLDVYGYAKGSSTETRLSPESQSAIEGPVIYQSKIAWGSSNQSVWGIGDRYVHVYNTSTSTHGRMHASSSHPNIYQNNLVFSYASKIYKVDFGSPIAHTDYSYMSKWAIDNTNSVTTMSSLGLDFSNTNGRLYSADTLNDRIVMFNPNSLPTNGAVLGTFGSNGSANGQFDGIGGVAVAPNGQVYVSDQGNNRVQRFSSTGTYLGKWTVTTPRALAVAPNGQVYVIDDDFGINRYSSTGTLLNSTGGLDASDLTVDPSGKVAYLAPRWDTVTVLNASLGTQVRTWDLPCRDDGGLDICWGGSAIDSDQFGNFFIANGWVDEVNKYSNTGTEMTFWGEPGAGNRKFGNIRGITVADSGNVFTADEALDRIQKWVPDGVVVAAAWTTTPSVFEGAWARVAGTVKSDSVGVPNSPIYIQKRKNAGNPWEWHATRYTTGSGFFDVWFSAHRSYQYRAVFPRGNGTASNIVPISVTQSFTIWNPYSTITYGGWTKIHGLLKINGSPTSSKKVYLQVWDYGSSTWKWKATTTTSGSGYYRFWFKPYGTSHYRVATWGSQHYSDQMTKTVRKKVTMRPSTWNMNLGQTNRINIEVQPTHAGSIAYLREWDTAQQKWVWVKTLTMNSQSKASYNWTPTTSGWHALRVFAPHHWDHTWNDTRVHWIKVN